MNAQTPIKAEFKVWFTPQEMADAAAQKVIRDVPETKQGINDLARRENWQRYHALVKTEKGRGGTITRYHIDLLPLDVRLQYYRKFLKVTPDHLMIAGDEAFKLNDRERQERSARMITVRLANDFHRLNAMKVVTSDHLFALTFNAGQIDGMPEWVFETIGKLSVRSLQRWRAQVRGNNGMALAYDPAKCRKGTGLLDAAYDGRVRAHILAWIADAPGMSASIIREQVEFKFGRELPGADGVLYPLPKVRMFQTYIAQLQETEKATILAYSNPDKFRSTMKLVGKGAYRFVTRPNQMWMIDASPVDALCVDGRWTMYACIDVATRRYIITFSKTAKSEAVALLVRRAIMEWGVPEVIKTDNGSDFVSASIKRLFDDLDTAPDTSRAYSPAEKGIVERGIKTFQHEVAPQLPGYIGHNVADRKAIESKKSFAQRLGADEHDLFEVSMTIEELRQHTDDWLKYVYNERVHSALNGLSPNEAAAQSSTPIRRVEERALDVLLMQVPDNNGLRKVGHQGIKIKHLHYLSGKIMVGTEVFCRHHPDDMGQIFVYSADGHEFLDMAVCPELSGVNPAEFAKATTAAANALVAERLKEVKAEVRDIKKGPSAIARTIAVAKRRVEERDAASANVIRMPKREESHSTPALAAALDAITLPGRTPVAKPLNADAAAVHAELMREAEQAEPCTIIHLDPDAGLTPGARNFKRAKQMEAAIAAGGVLSDADARWLTNFQRSTDYQVGTDFLTDFDFETALRMAFN